MRVAVHTILRAAVAGAQRTPGVFAELDLALTTGNLVPVARLDNNLGVGQRCSGLARVCTCVCMTDTAEVGSSTTRSFTHRLGVGDEVTIEPRVRGRCAYGTLEALTLAAAEEHFGAVGLGLEFVSFVA